LREGGVLELVCVAVEKRESNPGSRIVLGRFPFAFYSILDVIPYVNEVDG
jgi:hypothetical protein